MSWSSPEVDQAWEKALRSYFIGTQIWFGYLRYPQSEDEFAWIDAAVAEMVAEEPW